ncbi:MAG TPA: hypothetical protein VKZ53_11620 [Candidatus Angelobacter sp.]|nr:hypothetical protein [Candidatus Angelobacter sp.]
MPRLSVLIHVRNHEIPLGRVLNSVLPADEFIVVDHGSQDGSLRVARQHGARTMRAVPGVTSDAYARAARHDWVLCLLPVESLSDELESVLFEWKESALESGLAAYNLAIHEQAQSGWKILTPETRLVSSRRSAWKGNLPQPAMGPTLSGHLRRFPI